MTPILATAFLLLIQAGVPPKTATVAGIVVKAGSGDPIASAGVELSRAAGSGGETSTAATGPDGRFIFKDVSPGEYRLAATHAGYVRAEYGQRAVDGSPWRGLTMKLVADQHLKDASIALTQTAAVYGRVVDENGAPVPNAYVTAERYEIANGQRGLMNVKEMPTNDLGEYRLFWLPPCRYYINARRQPGGDPYYRSELEKRALGLQVILPGDEPVVPFYYPGTTDIKTARAVELRPSDNLGGMDIRITPVPGRRISGVIANRPVPTGPDQNGLQVRLEPRDSTPTFWTSRTFRSGLANPSTGAFEFRGVLPGSYYLSATAYGAAANGRNLFAGMNVEVVETDLENIKMSLAPGFDVSARVSIDGRIADESEMKGLWIFVQAKNSSASSVSGGAASPPSPGALVFRNMAPGDYRFVINKLNRNPNEYVKSMRLGGVDILNDGLHLDGPLDRAIELELGSNGGRVTGIAVDDKSKPDANVSVVIVPVQSRNRLDLYKFSSTDASGRFQIAGLAPGDYQVFAWEDAPPGVWLPEFIRDYERRGTPVHIDEGSSQTVQVLTIPASR